MKKVCIVGGGAAGLMAAYAAAKNGNDVLLFEKNEKLGKKSTLRERDAVILPTTFLPTNFWKMSSAAENFLRAPFGLSLPKALWNFLSLTVCPLKPNAEAESFPFPTTRAMLPKLWKKPVVRSEFNFCSMKKLSVYKLLCLT